MDQNKFVRLKFLIQKLREKGKIETILKLIDKYNLTQVSEDYYD
jgi:hypothetical protein